MNLPRLRNRKALAFVPVFLTLLGITALAAGQSDKAGTGKTELKGVFRITRHPMTMGMGLFGLMHLLGAQVNAAELAFFGGFVVFALLGCRHQDQRKLVTAGEEFRRFHEQTPFLPFTGPGPLQGLKEMPLAIVVGIVVTAVLRYFHPTHPLNRHHRYLPDSQRRLDLHLY